MMSKFESGRAITFDFESKEINDVSLTNIPQKIKENLFCWAHLSPNEGGYEVLKSVGIDKDIIERIMGSQDHGVLRFGRSALHCTLMEAVVHDDDLELSPIHLIIVLILCSLCPLVAPKLSQAFVSPMRRIFISMLNQEVSYCLNWWTP